MEINKKRYETGKNIDYPPVTFRVILQGILHSSLFFPPSHARLVLFPFFLFFNGVPEFHYCKIYLKSGFCSGYRQIRGYQFRENISQ